MPGCVRAWVCSWLCVRLGVCVCVFTCVSEWWFLCAQFQEAGHVSGPYMPPPVTLRDKAADRPPLCPSRLAIVSNVFEINVSHSMGLVPTLIIYAERGLAAEQQEYGKYFMFLH